MSVFELIVEGATEIPSTLREIRKRSPIEIKELRRRLAAHEPIISVSMEDHPLELSRLDGVNHQREYFLAAHAALLELGNVLAIQYRPSKDWQAEIVDLTMAKNLMESELQSIMREDD